LRAAVDVLQRAQAPVAGALDKLDLVQDSRTALGVLRIPADLERKAGVTRRQIVRSRNDAAADHQFTEEAAASASESVDHLPTELCVVGIRQHRFALLPLPAVVLQGEQALRMFGADFSAHGEAPGDRTVFRETAPLAPHLTGFTRSQRCFERSALL